MALATFVLVVYAFPAASETPRCPLEKPAILFHTGMPPEWGVTMPQIDICSEDADCAGCARCRSGMCQLEQTWDNCMCDDECARAGVGSCDRSSGKPLCPGVCRAAPPTRSTECGRGHDTVRIEPFTGGRCLVDGAAVRSPQMIVAAPTALARQAATCRAACAGVEAVGPVSELVVPGNDLVEQAAVTFAHGRWYVAWSGRRASATMVQRFTRDGRIEGPALRVEGTTAGAFVEGGPGGREVVLLGWVPPAYTPEGSRASLHRLTADLEAAAPAAMLRGPGGGGLGTSVERGADGALVSTGLHDRKGLLVRETRIPPDARADRPLAARDWWPGVEREGAFERIDGQPYFLDASQGGLRIRALQDGSVLGEPHRAFAVPVAEGRQIVLSHRIGDRWYVGAHAARNDPIVRVGALDASSLAPLGRVIVFPWPGGFPYRLIDGNGTPMLLGSVDNGAQSIRPTLVPLDFAAGAACSASTLSIASVVEPYQTVRAVAFEGDQGAAVITAWGTTDYVSRAFFTPLRCARRP